MEQWINLTMIFGTMFVLSSNPAKADSNPKLSNYFGEKITQIQESVAVDAGSSETEDNQLQDVNIDLSPSISFGVSNFLQLTISPEIDFVLTPQGLSQ